MWQSIIGEREKTTRTSRANKQAKARMIHIAMVHIAMKDIILYYKQQFTLLFIIKVRFKIGEDGSPPVEMVYKETTTPPRWTRDRCMSKQHYHLATHVTLDCFGKRDGVTSQSQCKPHRTSQGHKNAICMFYILSEKKTPHASYPTFHSEIQKIISYLFILKYCKSVIYLPRG